MPSWDDEAPSGSAAADEAVPLRPGLATPRASATVARWAISSPGPSTAAPASCAPLRRLLLVAAMAAVLLSVLLVLWLLWLMEVAEPPAAGALSRPSAAKWRISSCCLSEASSSCSGAMMAAVLLVRKRGTVRVG